MRYEERKRWLESLTKNHKTMLKLLDEYPNKLGWSSYKMSIEDMTTLLKECHYLNEIRKPRRRK